MGKLKEEDRVGVIFREGQGVAENPEEFTDHLKQKFLEERVHEQQKCACVRVCVCVCVYVKRREEER